jgi:hypothetical protein
MLLYVKKEKNNQIYFKFNAYAIIKSLEIKK